MFLNLKISSWNLFNLFYGPNIFVDLIFLYLIIYWLFTEGLFSFDQQLEKYNF